MSPSVALAAVVSSSQDLFVAETLTNDPNDGNVTRRHGRHTTFKTLNITVNYDESVGLAVIALYV